MNKTNLTQHPCANKCSNFKEEQCNHCLVQINCYQDEDQSMGTRTIIEFDFAKGDTVVFIDAFMPDHLMEVHQMQGDGILLDGNRKFALSHLLRHATTVELNAKRRLSLTEQSLGEVS
ncbi:hypothetical protein [Acinetobacter johnsonii]|uniref:hypothetical protein n=2 Tax=Acinetobacter johnsonii TaxID=40214 RepID=UPI001F2C7290|nr:hypothetical protein [Acinetobacter johnsonii]UJA00966.1 hypothetical protein GBN93_08470 [Acinetobacter johnsonii]